MEKHKVSTADKNYTVMMVAETDFYIANPVTHDNQIEFDCGKEVTSNNCSLPASPTSKDFDNPTFQKDDSGEMSSPRSEKSTPSTSSDSFYDGVSRYGWLCFNSNFLQKFNKPVHFLLVMVLAGIAQGLVVTGVAFTVITSIEKQFGFKSTEVALFGTTYDAAYGVCCVFVGYIGHVHKPRWLGFGLLLMAIGAFVTSIPKYIIGTYDAGVERRGDFCRLGNGTGVDENHCDTSSEWYYMFIFILGNVLLGIGATPLYTLGPAHIDEISDRGQGSLYLGVFYAAAAVGPALGFIIGLPILNAWVDVNQPAGSSLKPTDRNWVGAWWIGYLVGAGALLIPVIPMLGFPKQFPNSVAVQERKKELEDTVDVDENLNHDLKSVWPATLALLKNPTYICICLASSSESLAIGGFSTFIPKFVETQFHVTASDAALYTGLIVIPGAAGGIFLGGYLSQRCGWNCKQTLKAATLMAFIASVFVSTALVGCNGREVVGSNGQQYYNSSGHVSLLSTCNNHCQCNTQYYKPVCSVEDQRTYFSPCHAGCSKDHQVGDSFYNCSCLPSEVTHAVDGRCEPDCTLFPLFVFGAFFLMFFTFMNNVPIINATFRVVPEKQGSFAMGFQQVFVRFLGFIPAPTMFGKLIDESCNLWHTDECSGETTSCLEYDNTNFRYYMFALGVTTKLLSFIFMLMAYKFYQLPAVTSNKVVNVENQNNGNLYKMTETAGDNFVNSAHEKKARNSPEAVKV